jgi:hypothetical protein
MLTLVTDRRRSGCGGAASPRRHPPRPAAGRCPRWHRCWRGRANTSGSRWRWLGLGVEKPRRSRRRPRRESVPAGIAKLVAILPLPAFVEGRYFDVLAANALATAVSPRLVVGGNRLRDVFLEPAERELYPDWDADTERLAAGFRESVGTDTDDPRFIELRRPWPRSTVPG